MKRFKNISLIYEYDPPSLERAALLAKDNRNHSCVTTRAGGSAWYTQRRIQKNPLPCSVLTVKKEDVLEGNFDNDLRNIASHLAEAWAFLSAGNFISAIVKYRLVLTRNPFHLAALEGLVASHEKLGETVAAERVRRRLESARRVSHPHLDSTNVSF